MAGATDAPGDTPMAKKTYYTPCELQKTIQISTMKIMIIRNSINIRKIIFQKFLFCFFFNVSLCLSDATMLEERQAELCKTHTIHRIFDVNTSWWCQTNCNISSKIYNAYECSSRSVKPRDGLMAPVFVVAIPSGACFFAFWKWRLEQSKRKPNQEQNRALKHSPAFHHTALLLIKLQTTYHSNITNI